MNIKTRIKAVGKPTGDIDSRGAPICKVNCWGCGKEIRSDSNLEDMEYIKTKRGSELFLHRDCVDTAWQNLIK